MKYEQDDKQKHLEFIQLAINIIKHILNKKNFKKVEPGIPDCFYEKGGQLIFIEFKNISDGLKFNQFNFMMKHSSFNYRVIFFTLGEETEKIETKPIDLN